MAQRLEENFTLCCHVGMGYHGSKVVRMGYITVGGVTVFQHPLVWMPLNDSSMAAQQAGINDTKEAFANSFWKMTMKHSEVPEEIET